MLEVFNMENKMGQKQKNKAPKKEKIHYFFDENNTTRIPKTRIFYGKENNDPILNEKIIRKK